MPLGPGMMMPLTIRWPLEETWSLDTDMAQSQSRYLGS